MSITELENEESPKKSIYDINEKQRYIIFMIYCLKIFTNSNGKKNLRQTMNMSRQNELKSTGHRTKVKKHKKSIGSDDSSKLTRSYTSPLKTYARSVMSTITIPGEKNLSKV